MEDALRVIRELRRLTCLSDVRAILEDQPICVCGLDLSKASEANVLIARLNGIARDGIRDFSDRLNENADKLAPLMMLRSLTRSKRLSRPSKFEYTGYSATKNGNQRVCTAHKFANG